MRKVFEVIFLSNLLILFVLAQDNNQPFHLLDKKLANQEGNWNHSTQDLSAVFNAERIRFGNSFESEVLKYLGNDVERHYWISSFLEHPNYLQGNTPLPQLSLLIKQQGLLLLRGKTDQANLCKLSKLSVSASVLSKNLGLESSAIILMADAEKILSSDATFKSCFSEMSEYDRFLYDLIGKYRNILYKKGEKDKATNQLNAKSEGSKMDLELHKKIIFCIGQIYPKEVITGRVSGVIWVEYVVNEQGKVESARALNGHPLLQDLAVKLLQDLAVKSMLGCKFEPTILSGRPVKALGRLGYRFVPSDKTRK